MYRIINGMGVRCISLAAVAYIHSSHYRAWVQIPPPAACWFLPWVPATHVETWISVLGS